MVRKVGDAIHYELGAGEEKLIPFKLAKENKQPVAFTNQIQDGIYVILIYFPNF